MWRSSARAHKALENIVRRNVATQLNQKASIAHRVAVIVGFMTILVTPALDLAKIQSARDNFRTQNPYFNQDSEKWAGTHTPQHSAAKYLNSA